MKYAGASSSKEPAPVVVRRRVCWAHGRLFFPHRNARRYPSDHRHLQHSSHPRQLRPPTPRHVPTRNARHGWNRTTIHMRCSSPPCLPRMQPRRRQTDHRLLRAVRVLRPRRLRRHRPSPTTSPPNGRAGERAPSHWPNCLTNAETATCAKPAALSADNRGSIALMKHFGFTQFGTHAEAATDSTGTMRDMSYGISTL